jgi:tight adherence protein B
MIAFKPLVLLLGAAAAVLIALAGLPAIVSIWNRCLDRYTSWLVGACAEIDEPMAPARAQRLLAASILVPFVVFTALAAWPVGVCAATAGAAAPYLWLKARQAAYRRTMDNQLVDVLVLMANSMRSGLTLVQALELAATESKPPIVRQIATALQEIQLGQSIDRALTNMSDRVALPDLELAVHSIVTLRETGGNLSETFMTVANTIVERKKVEGKIASLTSQGLYQGYAMCAMPFVLGAMFFLIEPEYMGPMLSTGLGWAMWLAVIVLDLMGMWLILKIVKVDV